jgi:hypothetical protein
MTVVGIEERLLFHCLALVGQGLNRGGEWWALARLLEK